MVILLFGPPGCGKGTQAPLITRWLGIPAISTGEMLRGEVTSGSALGEEVKEVLARGSLVEDHLVNRILKERIQQEDCREGFLLDGYPRTVSQAAYLSELLDEIGMDHPLVIHLETPLSLLVERIAARRQCPSCQRIYNLKQRPPLRGETCDLDGTALIRRRDDYEHVVTERLRAYLEQTNAVLSCYDTRHCVGIDANQPVEAVFAQVEAYLSARLNRNCSAA